MDSPVRSYPSTRVLEPEDAPRSLAEILAELPDAPAQALPWEAAWDGRDAWFPWEMV